MKQAKRWSLTLASLLVLGLGPVRPAAADEAGRGAYQKMLRYTAWVIPTRGVREAGSGVFIQRAGKLVVTSQSVVGSESLLKVVFPQYDNGSLIGKREAYLDPVHHIPA